MRARERFSVPSLTNEQASIQDRQPWHFFVSTRRYPSEAGMAATASSNQTSPGAKPTTPAPTAALPVSFKNFLRETVLPPPFRFVFSRSLMGLRLSHGPRAFNLGERVSTGPIFVNKLLDAPSLPRGVWSSIHDSTLRDAIDPIGRIGSQLFFLPLSPISFH